MKHKLTIKQDTDTMCNVNKHCGQLVIGVLSVNPPADKRRLDNHRPALRSNILHQPTTQAATYTTRNKHNRRISMLPAGFEPMIPALKRLQAYASDRTASGIGSQFKDSLPPSLTMLIGLF